MPKLYLLRHMEASASLETPDIERTLTSHGIDQAKRVGNFLIQCNARPDLAFCSIAKRTQMSLLTIQVVGLNIQKTEFIRSLYNAPAGDILDKIQRSDENDIMVVAHNPGIHELARMLAGDGDPEKLTQLKAFYSPGTLTVLECPVKKWKDIQPGQNTLVDLFIPE
jgi:phosphohistidine phosphatase